MPKRKKIKSQPRKSKMAAAKRSKKAPRAKSAVKASRPKKAAKKKQSKKKTAKARVARPREILRNDSQRLIPGRQSGDFEGLSRAEQADSESVDELVEEGNTFEAGAVAGVEEADTADEREVHTHEVPEDDVPEEYDKD
jgi:N utilization substance protein A